MGGVDGCMHACMHGHHATSSTHCRLFRCAVYALLGCALTSCAPVSLALSTTGFTKKEQVWLLGSSLSVCLTQQLRQRG